jgi:hypothetical protein
VAFAVLKRSLEQTQSDVRLALHTKEAALLASESEQILHREMTPLVYITAGIDLENYQCVQMACGNYLTLTQILDVV